VGLPSGGVGLALRCRFVSRSGSDRASASQAVNGGGRNQLGKGLA
jgi:hypothetical protein